jgi:hypothetical protein
MGLFLFHNQKETQWRKHLGKKTIDELSVEDFEQLRIEIAAVMDHHLDDLLEMSFESIDIVLNL